MKETKVYVVKRPEGAYESYQEPIVKVFFNEKAAKSYFKEENAKLPLEQTEKCTYCCYKLECIGQKGKETPSCFKGDEYNYCENYFKYRDIQKLFIEEHEIDDIKDHDRELVKEVCEKIREHLSEQKKSLKDTFSPYSNGKAFIISAVEENLNKIEKEYEK